ncbi:DUF2889 domain-containing protein [Sphingomonadaceae bacterium OTU29LAMAA1]|nr:DUF2889 domain-containing protein [Sphingomonadaceae bacterium OTU29LAMAA1]
MTAPAPDGDAAPQRLLPHFDLNPDFGTGAFCRRIRLRHRDGVVVGALDDNNHAMWVRLCHADGAVTTIDGGFHRWPTTGCLGAADILQDIVGRSIAATRDVVGGDGRTRHHCTHLFDLAMLALAMARRPEGDRLWDAVVPDAHGGRTTATIGLDGTIVHAWMLDEVMIMPAVGRPQQSLLSGFAPWARTHFSDDAFEGATVLRMAAFTARARAHITDNHPWPLADFPERRDACHAYRPPQVNTAEHRIGVVRDFSAGVIEAPMPDLMNRSDQ